MGTSPFYLLILSTLVSRKNAKNYFILSKMRTSVARYGQKMGILRSDLRVDTRYRISPSETKALKGYWGHMVPNTLWRFRSNIFYMLPPFIGGYMIIDHANKTHERLSRKQPGDFDD